MQKDQLERSFRKGGTAPVLREPMGDYDLFVSDGFSRPPHLNFQRFGIEPDEFPHGMFVTIWWLGKGEKLFFGQPLFMEVTEFRQGARINAARHTAQKFLASLQKAPKWTM